MIPVPRRPRLDPVYACLGCGQLFDSHDAARRHIKQEHPE